MNAPVLSITTPNGLHHPMALEAINRIAALYAIETQGKDLDVAARTQLRQDESLPLLQSMHDWLLQIRVTVADGGVTANMKIRRSAVAEKYADVVASLYEDEE